MKSEKKSESTEKVGMFVENIDYYFENGLMILTEGFLRRRGYCCRNRCRNCPYGFVEVKKL